jgi:hypothetical protein
MINKEQNSTMLYRTRVLYNYFFEEVGLIKIFKKGTFHSFIKERGRKKKKLFFEQLKKKKLQKGKR